jgi:hypothetical protein
LGFDLGGTVPSKKLLGDKWPNSNHPATDEPFEKCLFIEQDQQIQEFRWGPPIKPSRNIYNYDEIDPDEIEPVFVRTMTEEEYIEALNDYEAERKRWYDSNGIMHIPTGDIKVTGKFVTKSGNWAKGEWLHRPGEWYWSEWWFQ